MFRKIIRFFKRIFQSKGFRFTALAVLGILAFNFLYCYFYAVAFFMRHEGMTFREAVTLISDALFYPLPRTYLSIAVGIVIGLLGYFSSRKKKESAEEEKPAETPESVPVQEEEFTETKQYMSR